MRQLSGSPRFIRDVRRVAAVSRPLMHPHCRMLFGLLQSTADATFAFSHPCLQTKTLPLDLARITNLLLHVRVRHIPQCDLCTAANMGVDKARFI
jgi:hypothetical protein